MNTVYAITRVVVNIKQLATNTSSSINTIAGVSYRAFHKTSCTIYGNGVHGCTTWYRAGIDKNISNCVVDIENIPEKHTW
jgi:hypothetical protein